MSNYEYLGKRQTGCSELKYSLQNPDIKGNFGFGLVFRPTSLGSNKLRAKLGALKAKNYSAIISAEEFDAMPQKGERTWESLQYAFSPYLNQTQVIATYRHFHEILLSLYYERTIGQATLNAWNKGAVPYFSTWLEQKLNISNFGRLKKEIGTFNLVDSFQQHSYNVTIFNFHDYTMEINTNEKEKKEEASEDLVTRFICGLPNARELCEAYKKDEQDNDPGKDKPHRKSQSEYIQYDRIGKIAFDQGLIARDLRRSDVTDAIEHRVQKLQDENVELPFRCCSEKRLKQMLAMSVEEGIDMWKDKIDKKAFRATFEAFVKRRKFCAIDAEALMEDKDWQLFFQNKLRNSTSQPLKRQ